ncbi:mCG147693 [Mus musculus]|nr:mCG147693 [Mus musculus]
MDWCLPIGQLSNWAVYMMVSPLISVPSPMPAFLVERCSLA